MNRPRYIVVEGPIGVGKTSLVNALAARYRARTVFEIVEENPFLSSFYDDRAQYAFQTQLFFLLSRYKQQQELFQPDLLQPVTVSDYLFAKDKIFAQLTLSSHELALYERVYDALTPRVLKPDLVIYLQARQDVLLTRIKKRGREFERQFDPAYLEQVSRAYNDFFGHYGDTPLLVLNTSDFDYLTHTGDFDTLVNLIEGHTQGVKHLTLQSGAPAGK
jgi:deoxyadenosine/deoxycytidine kinase